MMRSDRIADAIRRGTGRVASMLGDWCEAFRPHGSDMPLAPEQRFLRLQAMFAPPGAGLRPPEFGGAAWWGSFDAAYTRVGDYIRRPESVPGAGDEAVWFIASQEKLLPVLCIRTNRVVDILRPSGEDGLGVGGYGGAARQNAVPVARCWPVSLLAVFGSGMAKADMPASARGASWQVMVPDIPGVTLRRGDIVADDLKRTGVIVSAERSALGWRLLVREAAA